MLLSLDTGVSALEQFQQSLAVIGNNIANVNTVGFKSATVGFADTLSETLGSNSAGSMQVGTGVLTASISNQFTQGSITSTGVPTAAARCVMPESFPMYNRARASQHASS